MTGPVRLVTEAIPLTPAERLAAAKAKATAIEAGGPLSHVLCEVIDVLAGIVTPAAAVTTDAPPA